MGSNSRDVQTAQKERAEQELAARKATLSERGVSEEKIAIDGVVRRLESNVKQITGRLRTIDGLEERKKLVAKQKAARAAAQKKAKAAGKKKKAAEPEPKKGKKAKKKKK